MSKFNLYALSQPEVATNDPLHDLIRQGARDLIARAVESELQGLLDQYADVSTPDGRQAVVRNGHLPKRTIQTGVGDVEVQVPKVRDRSGFGIRFNSPAGGSCSLACGNVAWIMRPNWPWATALWASVLGTQDRQRAGQAAQIHTTEGEVRPA